MHLFRIFNFLALFLDQPTCGSCQVLCFPCRCHGPYFPEPPKSWSKKRENEINIHEPVCGLHGSQYTIPGDHARLLFIKDSVILGHTHHTTTPPHQYTLYHSHYNKSFYSMKGDKENTTNGGVSRVSWCGDYFR